MTDTDVDRQSADYKLGRCIGALMKNTTIAMVRQRFTVWVDLPAVSGDGWSKYPDYSAEETARVIRRALHDAGVHADVEHADTTEVQR